MPDPTNESPGVILALDAYEQNAIAERTISHRDSPLLAGILVRALIRELVHLADRQNLDIDKVLAELVRNRGALADTHRAGNYTVLTEVQIRRSPDGDTKPMRYPLLRGFITELRAAPGSDVDECVVRVPGVAERIQVTAAELELTKPFPPVLSRTETVIDSAAHAEAALVDLVSQVTQHQRDGSTIDEAVLADLTSLSAALATWSGGTQELVLRQIRERLRHHASNAPASGTAPFASQARSGAPSLSARPRLSQHTDPPDEHRPIQPTQPPKQGKRP
ncbi:hypothetical protein [Actinomadura roseirufa]|uniref:hypothetical protein n=1 Tax=Actinomadura roseirufa TaxID=2094049 RepID=UPI0010415A73|nr:hypothetical protein [Actinomadura roseirufa]